MEYKKRKHNTPISTVIKRFRDKKSGKVKTSRSELHWRFDALDWNYQKQILFAFLESGKSDRQWAYRKLFAFWDDCFIPVLQELREKYNEDMLTCLIICYFPVDFLKKNYARLSEGRNYYEVCARMYDVEGFVVDKTRLSEYDLLRIKHVLGETVTLREAEALFFMLVYKFCRGTYKFRAWQTLEHHVHTQTLYMLDRPIINTMLHEISSLEIGGGELSWQLKRWIRYVTNKFLSKHERLADRQWRKKEEEALMREMQKSFCYEQIPPEYTRVWDTFDCNNQQQFLCYLEKIHEEYIKQKESEKEYRAEASERLMDNPLMKDLFEELDLENIEPEGIENGNTVAAMECLMCNPSMQKRYEDFDTEMFDNVPF